MKTQEEIRKLPNLLITEKAEDGGCGILFIGTKRFASVIWSNGGGWDHVSVCPFERRRVPTWDEMCRLKDMFFDPEEVVVQYHPARSQYVNNLENCLHLFRPQTVEIPVPPSIMVGIRKGQTADECKREIAEITNYKTKDEIIREIESRVDPEEDFFDDYIKDDFQP